MCYQRVIKAMEGDYESVYSYIISKFVPVVVIVFEGNCLGSNISSNKLLGQFSRGKLARGKLSGGGGGEKFLREELSYYTLTLLIF